MAADLPAQRPPRVTVVRVDRRGLPGPRLWILGARVHHGLVGACALGASLLLRQPSLAVAGALAMWHDAHDFPWSPVEPHAAPAAGGVRIAAVAT